VQAQVRRFTENLPRSSFPMSMAELEAVRLRIGHLLNRPRFDQRLRGQNKIKVVQAGALKLTTLGR